MSSFPPRLVPLNRHLLIVPHFKRKEESSPVLLPDDFSQPEDRHIKATVLEVSRDCQESLRGLHRGSKEIIIDSSMIEEVVVKDKSYYMILENYVVALVKESPGDSVFE